MFRKNEKKQIIKNTPTKTIFTLVKIFVVLVVVVTTFIALFADAPSSSSYFTHETRSQSETFEIND